MIDWGTYKIEELRPIDLVMMRAALQDQPDLAQYILRIVLGMPDLDIASMRFRFDDDMPQAGPSLSFNIRAWADGTEYYIDLRRNLRCPHPRLAGYYAAMLDKWAMEERKSKKELPASRLIFITETDCLGTGMPRNHVVATDHEGQEVPWWGQEYVYFNTGFKGRAAEDEKELLALAHDFLCKDPKDMHPGPLADRMRFLKETEFGNAYVRRIAARMTEHQD